MDRKKIRIYGNKIERVRKEVRKGIAGQKDVIDSVIKCLICNSHGLMEGVPGLAKTLLVRIIASLTGVGFKRIQFTPDLLPSDVTGSQVYIESTDSFEIQKGPVFANFVLADEINRSPPKVQSALLEAMEEREVTVGGKTLKLPSPFIVLATQNPLEQSGVFPLSLAQKDRFLFKIYLDYPKEEDEFVIIEKNVKIRSFEEMKIKRVITAKEILEMYDAVKRIEISDMLKKYIMDIVEATRDPEKHDLKEIKGYIKYGVSPRASIYLCLASKATALMKGRSHVTVDDVKGVVPSVLGHRLVLSYKGESERISSLDIVERILQGIGVT